MVKKLGVHAPGRKSAVKTSNSVPKLISKKKPQQRNEHTSLTQGTEDAQNVDDLEWYQLTGKELKLDGQEEKLSKFNAAKDKIEARLSHLMASRKDATELEIQIMLLPEYKDKLEKAGKSKRNGIFRKNCAIYHHIEGQVWKHNKSLLREVPSIASKFAETEKGRKLLKEVFPRGQPDLPDPVTNYHPVYDQTAINGLVAFLQFYFQDFTEAQVPDLFKAFFNKREVFERLQQNDRLILCFGLDTQKRPVLDVGFVVAHMLDEFRRHYLRKEMMTSYDMCFDSKFACFDTCRVVLQDPRSTGSGAESHHRGSENSCAVSGSDEPVGRRAPPVAAWLPDQP
jgi:hypothetical protein